MLSFAKGAAEQVTWSL